MKGSLWFFELAIALRSSLSRLLLVAFGLTLIYALGSGVALQSAWSRAVAANRSEIEAQLEREQENIRLGRVESWSQPGAVTSQKMHLTLPPAPGVVLATGDATLRPHSGEFSYLRRVDLLFKNNETMSALVLSLGRLDFAWVCIVLLPLLLIALGYDVISADRDASRLGLLTLQAGSLRSLVARRLAVRLVGPTAVVVAGVMAAIAWGARADVALLSLGLVLTWAFAWALAMVVASLRASSSQTAALSLVIGWLVVVVVVPATLDLASDALAPVPSRAEDVAEERRVQIEVNTRSGALLERYIVDHPELVGENRDEWQRTSAVVLRETEAHLEPVWARQARVREEHARLATLLGALSPASTLDSALRGLAGTDGRRHEAFVSQARSFTWAWRERYAPKLFRVERFTPEELAALPRFEFKEPPVDPLPALASLVQMLLIGAVLVLGLRRGLSSLSGAPAGVAIMLVVLLGTTSASAQDAPVSVPPPAPVEAPPAEVTVRGTSTEAQRRVNSAEAVTVVDTQRARQRSADLGEVLARTQGVSVQRSGALGSHTHFSLNGLYHDQIRFFLNGVPLELAGYPFGIANVPVNLVERVEVYRGVVPIRYGADALGGAVDVIQARKFSTGASASYQSGSFGTFRTTLTGGVHDKPSGLWVGGTGFFDYAVNNYSIDVTIPDARGRPRPERVTRFHDRYRAHGGSIEVGLIDRPWAERLLLRLFTAQSSKDIQHDNIMTTPYGEATSGNAATGGTIEYAHALSGRVYLNVIAGYTYRTIDFVDKSDWVYNWRGQRIRQRQTAGEISGRPIDQTVWQHSALARISLGYQPHEHHRLRVSVSPTLALRSGDTVQNNPKARDPLTADQDVFALISGIEHESTALCASPGDRSGPLTPDDCTLLNVAFVKDYVYLAFVEEVLTNGAFRRFASDKHRLGLGDSLRLRLTPWLAVKASYEYATRLPGPDELFGNGVLIQPNVNVRPEVSHNVNLGPRVTLRRSPIGDLIVDVSGFWRETDSLIVLLGDTRRFTYQNVFGARGLGVEGSFAWTTPLRFLSLEGSATYADVRNTSSEGTFGDYEGDRIPARPWLFASWGARLATGRLFDPDDNLSFFYAGRYVHSFFRGWESAGLRETKQIVDSQVSHTLGTTYALSGEFGRTSATLEVQNLTNARLYDFFGVQRPGRAVFVKATGEI